jgi:hypothetical protein
LKRSAFAQGYGATGQALSRPSFSAIAYVSHV